MRSNSMEYERIHKAQTGMISPSKLRMKLIGPLNGKKKDGSNINSARTSPARLDDSEFVKNSLLTSNAGDFDDEVTSTKMPNELGTAQMDRVSTQPKQTLPKGKSDFVHGQMQQLSKGEGGDLSAIHPMRTPEDENLDYDSNASLSSFEFHKERVGHAQFTRSLSRPMSSKWNDAEKWIMSRQNVQQTQAKKSTVSSQANRGPATNTIRVIHELASYDPKSSVGADLKHVDVYQSSPQMMLEKFSFDPSTAHPVPTQGYGGGVLIDQFTQIKVLNEVDLSCIRSPEEDPTALPVIRSVCMRDMGTEMTPATSLEPSRAATPMGATTPLRSPTSSIPSTPRRGPGGTPMERGTDNSCHHITENGKRELTDEELKLKTRSEIVALGVQLGKMNIAAWASTDDQEMQAASAETCALEELERIEYEKRAAIWEETEKSKHAARYKREEILIQAWESQQKAKLEAERQRMEARVEQKRAQAQAKMVKKISMARQKTEEKRAAAESRKSRDAEKTAAQAEYIRQTGRMPSSHCLCCSWWPSSHHRCCGWWS